MNKNLKEDEFTARGVKNPKVIDLVRFDADIDSVILEMIEDRPWEEKVERLEEISAKFNSYLDYVVDGWLIKQYPQYEGKKIIFELSVLKAKSEGALSEHYDNVCQQIKAYASKYNIQFNY